MVTDHMCALPRWCTLIQWTCVSLSFHLIHLVNQMNNVLCGISFFPGVGVGTDICVGIGKFIVTQMVLMHQQEKLIYVHW